MKPTNNMVRLSVGAIKSNERKMNYGFNFNKTKGVSCTPKEYGMRIHGKKKVIR